MGRLHIYHKCYQVEPSYADILHDRFDWHSLDVKSELDDIAIGVANKSIIDEIKSLVIESRRIRRFITEGLTIFPNLQTVSMGGIGGRIYNSDGMMGLDSQLDHFFDKEFNGVSANGRQALPHALLDLPAVQHYCQSVGYGPLALPSNVILPKSPIQTFTSHQLGTSMFLPYQYCRPDTSPPIVLGAINRYYVVNAKNVDLRFDADLPFIATLLIPIVAMFFRGDIAIADPESGAPIPLGDLGSGPLFDGTTIEIYNFVRTHHLSKKYRLPKNELKRQAKIIGVLPPQSLSFFQESLDKDLPEAWKGKVKFRNWEEAPPCPACGFDLGGVIQDRQG